LWWLAPAIALKAAFQPQRKDVGRQIGLPAKLADKLSDLLAKFHGVPRFF
jgi:hypothetical protein